MRSALTPGRSATPRLTDDWGALLPVWRGDVALRSDFARRQALVEIDVLTALALGLTLEELLTIYRVQFPSCGSTRPTLGTTWRAASCSPSLKGCPASACPAGRCGGDSAWTLRRPGRVAESDTALGWEDIRGLREGVITRRIADDTLPGGPVERLIEYHAPFDRCDREQDYRRAWKAFARWTSSERAHQVMTAESTTWDIERVWSATTEEKTEQLRTLELSAFPGLIMLGTAGSGKTTEAARLANHERASGARMTARQNYLHLAWLLRWWDSPENFSAWLRVCDEEPVKSILGNQKSIDLASEEAKQLRNHWELVTGRSMKKARPPLDPPPRDRVLRVLGLAETKDIRYFKNLCRELTLEPTSSHYGLGERFLTRTPGWREANEETRARIVGVAKTYLSAEGVAAEASRDVSQTHSTWTFLGRCGWFLSANRLG